MRVAYVGSLVSPALVHEFSGGSIAGNKYQSGIVSEFTRSGVTVDPVIVPPIASFPRDRRMAVALSADEVGVRDAEVIPFVNFLGAKQSTIAFGIFWRLLAWAWHTRRDHARLLLVYNAFSFIALPVLLVGKLTRIPAACVVADIQPPGVGGFVARSEAQVQRAALARFDALVQVSEHIGHDFAPGTPALLVEGGVWAEQESGTRTAQFASDTKDVRVVLFSGALDENSGIGHLLDAFELIEDPLIRMEVFGKGPLQAQVERAVHGDPRILFRGYVDNQEVIAAQSAADVLVCPRLPDAHTTRYSFPSKVMEYLATGKPVVCTRLPGIPAEYEEHLLMPVDNSPAALAASICAGLNLDSPVAGRQEFVDQKRWFLRSQQVAEFLKGVVAK